MNAENLTVSALLILIVVGVLLDMKYAFVDPNWFSNWLSLEVDNAD